MLDSNNCNNMSNPGEKTTFSEYHNEKNVVAEGQILDVDYEIHRVNNSHYSLYAKFDNICPCMISTQNLPVVPTGRDINFGPTEDNWIGFTTNTPKDYNYNSDWNKLEGDFRENPEQSPYVDKIEIKHWTPRILEESFVSWIRKTKWKINKLDLQCSHN